MSESDTEGSYVEKQKNRKQILVILIVSWILTIVFALLYMQQLQKEKQKVETGQFDASEMEALQADYADAVSRADQLTEKEAERQQVNDTVLSFLDAYFLLPNSREALLSGCENYVSEEAKQTLEVLAKNREYNQKKRELFYYREDCTEHSEEDGIYEAFAIFTIRETANGEASDQSYMLVLTVEVDESSAVITEIQTLIKIYFHAD